MKSPIPLASEKEQSRRVALCNACPELIHHPFKACSRCGCIVAWKSKIAAGKCPAGKW